MHLFLQFNGRFSKKADRIARAMAAAHGFTRFSGISTSEGHVRWLLDGRRTPIRYGHIQVLPELWRRAIERGRADAARLRELEERYGSLWRFVIADRNLGHTFLTGTLFPDTELRRRAADPGVVFACLDELFGYYERRFEEDRPDLVLYQVVASAPALVAAAVCGRMGIPFLTLGKTKLDDRHHLASNALMQPDAAIARYADPGMAAGPAALERVRLSMESEPPPTDHFIADRRTHARRHGGSLGAFAWERLRTLPGALRRDAKPYPPDPRASTAWQIWQWETAIRWNYRRLSRAGVFDRRDVGGDYVFFPLSVTPEASTCVVAPHYADQLVLIGALARSLPAGWQLVIKDHLPMCGRRRRLFYDLATQYQNTVMVDPTLRSTELIRHCRATVAIAGTSGWEAMIAGKPVVAFGSAWYLATGLGVFCKDLDGISAALHEAVRLSDAVPAPERGRRIARMIQALTDESFSLDHRHMWAAFSDAELDAATPTWAAIAGAAAGRLAAMRTGGGPPHPFDPTAWTRDRTPSVG